MIWVKRIAALTVGIAFLAGSSMTARAVVSVGDTPQLNFKSLDGAPISLDMYKGKIVVVDFWASWCGPCMAEAPHMVELNNKYAPQGLQFVGVSLDQDKSAMIAAIKEKSLAWPQYFGGDAISGAWGVNSIPRTFIIGPDGKLLWTGHPAGIDGPLEQAFKDHPPVLVDPKVLADAKATLAAAKSALSAGDTKAAMASLAKVPEAARADKSFATESANFAKELETAGAKLLQEVDPMIAAGQYVQAVARLKELSSGLAGLPAGAQAQKKLTELQAKPEVKSAIAKASRAENAQKLFDAAQKLKDAKKDDQAYPQFKTVASEYPDTDAGAKAADVVKSYEKDSAFIKRVTDTAAASKATSTLKLAQSYAGAGRNDLARRKYQEVIDQYPGTTYADQAKKALSSIPAE